ncbi:MAG: cyclodeaminase/cyclohydrolase family protein [Thermodesulfobacteriota bacterium]|nr:cyclodeaminase/cyclohydrolase family protein [Thermodesulfobacteriota bacterium]
MDGVMGMFDLSLKEFIDRLSSGSPTPGGGSVSALAGALSAALFSMVSRLTLGREKYRDVWQDMERLRDGADDLAMQLLGWVEKDSEAYDQVITAYKLPKKDTCQKTKREKAIDQALKNAALVPMETLNTLDRLAGLIDEILEKANPNCITDIGVAAQLIQAGATGAAYNIRINLSGISDKGFSGRLETETRELLARISDTVRRSEEILKESLH